MMSNNFFQAPRHLVRSSACPSCGCGQKQHVNKKGSQGRQQHGGGCGGGSDFRGLFHSQTVSPRALSAYTLARIDQAPMFNPLRANTVFPTGTSGVVPTGAYLFHNLPPTPAQGKNLNQVSQAELQCLCQKNGIKTYDEIEGRVIPRNKEVMARELAQVVQENNQAVAEAVAE